jgi:hypothetical protein
MSVRPIALAVTLALAACGRPPETPTPSDVLNAAAAPVAIVTNEPAAATVAPTPPPVAAIAAPMATSTPPSQPRAPANARASVDPVVNASSPEALIASLQSIEAQVSTSRLDALKASLMVYQLRAQQRYTAIAMRDPTNAKFNDTQLFNIAFGDVNGMTVSQIIDSARLILPTVVDEKGNPK